MLCLGMLLVECTGQTVPLSPTAPVSEKLCWFSPSASFMWPVWGVMDAGWAIAKKVARCTQGVSFNQSHSAAFIGLRECELVRSGVYFPVETLIRQGQRHKKHLVNRLTALQADSLKQFWVAGWPNTGWVNLLFLHQIDWNLQPNVLWCHADRLKLRE